MKPTIANNNLFDSILNLGVDNKTSNSETKKIRIVNGVSFFGGLVLIITGIVLFIMFSPFQEINYSLLHDFLFGEGEQKELARANFWIIFPVIDTIVGIFCLSMLVLNALKFTKLTILSLCIMATLYSSFLFLAGGIKVAFIFFIPAILPIMFFEKKVVYIMLGVANFIVLLVISFILHNHNSLLYMPTQNYFPTYCINIFFAFTIIFLIVTHFKNQNAKNELILAEQNKELQLMTQEISHQRDELKSKNYKLKVTNATKDKFFSIIAHDLKNPFNGILGFSTLLLKSLNDDRNKESLEYANFISTSAKNAFTLLENLLEWSRSQTGGITFKPKSIDLDNLLQKSINICNNIAEVKNIEVKYFNPTNIKIFADENMLNTVLRNLITNAIKYTQNGGKVMISSQVAGSMVEVNIADTGIGMNRETLNKLFKIHELKSVEGTNKETGTGLGLILCKSFIENHGGKIWVESEPNKGSCFTFSVPKAEDL